MDLFIGAMSGTSMDAVDVAAVHFDDGHPELLATLSRRWPAELRERLQGFASGVALDATAIAHLHTETGHFFADTINELLHRASIKRDAVCAIGCHGQTVAHDVDTAFPATFQLGNPAVIAERTGLTTVADFRSRDVAASGQGAPLAPAFHAAVLRSAEENRVILNLGGIANITVLSASGDEAPLGFDTGPANCLMDGWIKRHRGEAFDRDGAWAAAASIDADLLRHLSDDDYFRAASPKSTGTQYFSAQWLDHKLSSFGARVEIDVVHSTLAALTISTVADAIRDAAPTTQRVLVCGGGERNRHLITGLRLILSLPVESTAGYGIDPEWMECMAFAWLARRALTRQPGNLPSVTGATGERILGAIYPA